AQVQQRLVVVEAGAVGGDLQQHAAGFAEVDRGEVGAVPDLGDVHAALGQGAPPPLLGGGVRGPVGDVVHGPGGDQAALGPRVGEHVDHGAHPVAGGGGAEPVPAAALLGEAEPEGAAEHPRAEEHTS